MDNINDIRMIFTQRFLTGGTLQTWIHTLFFALQGHGKHGSQQFLPGPGFSVKNICMGNFVHTDSILQMLNHIFMPHYLIKSCHSLHLLYSCVQYNISLM